MKKILLFSLIISLGILNITTSYASSLPIYDETYNNNQGAIYANGTHTVIGTVLVRTSNKLMATQQKELEQKVIDALTRLE